MRHAHIIHLIEQAAASLEEGAEALRSAHSFAGNWTLEDESDEQAKSHYERDIDLVDDLLGALDELGACHQTCVGLEQLLRTHRLEGTPINYADLAALLPESTT